FDYSLAPNFADINNDGWPDLLIASDFGTSMVFLNNQDGTFKHVTNPTVITDQYGMGATVGDYNNDGNLDWFVTSIWSSNPDNMHNGNRLYRGHGDGTFEDVTTQAGVRMGGWGWGATLADLDNDGNLDIFHVNGFPPDYFTDPSVLFLSNGSGTF